MIDRPIRLDERTPTRAASTAVPHIVPQSGTTPTERLLLFVAVTTLPLEKHIPTVAGMSLSFLLFSALGVYLIVNRSRFLGAIWYHPIFLVAYAFVGVSALLEFSSPLSRYSEIFRFAQMIGGAVCVAALCRDRAALTAGLYGHIAAALWVAVVLYLTSYGTLQEAGPTSDFQEASNLRGELDAGFRANKNALGFVCIQGAIVALTLPLVGRFNSSRLLLWGMGIFCFVAAFLVMSRSAVLTGLVSVATILYAHGVKQGKALILAAVIGLGIYILVPEAVWSRMTFSTEVGQSGRMEARAHIYTMALNRLPEYFLAGVGAGNYHGGWALEKGFVIGVKGGLIGAHNALLQILIFWGVLGFFMYLWFIWLVYRVIPSQCGRDALSLALLGVTVSLGMLNLESHVFYDKHFAFGIGLLIGARQWIWPRGVVSAVEMNRGPSYHGV